jgi:glutamate 5-kinase
MSASERKEAARLLTQARRIVVKVGSTLLVEQASGRLNRAWLESLAEDAARARQRGQDLAIVSSGAIALGRRHLGLPEGKLRLEESQAAAAVGQIRLAHAWKEVLEQHDLVVSQVLLTFDDTEIRRRYLNARSTLNTCCDSGRCRSLTGDKYRGDGRDPLRRQRSARGACRTDDQCRLPGAALGCRWAVHR